MHLNSTLTLKHRVSYLYRLVDQFQRSKPLSPEESTFLKESIEVASGILDTLLELGRVQEGLQLERDSVSEVVS